MKTKRNLNKFLLTLLPVFITLSCVGVGFGAWVLATDPNIVRTGNVSVEIANTKNLVKAEFIKHERNYDFFAGRIVDKGTQNFHDNLLMLEKYHFRFTKLNENDYFRKMYFNIEFKITGLSRSFKEFSNDPCIGHNHGWYSDKDLTLDNYNASTSTQIITRRKNDTFINEFADTKNTFDLCFTFRPLNYSMAIKDSLKGVNFSLKLEIFNMTNEKK